MNGLSRDDIIRMAREAGGLIDEVDWYFEYENLERFAALVAAAEREACAKVCDVRAQGYPTCKWSDGYKQGGAASAAAIRARGSDAA